MESPLFGVMQVGQQRGQGGMLTGWTTWRSNTGIGSPCDSSCWCSFIQSFSRSTSPVRSAASATGTLPYSAWTLCCRDAMYFCWDVWAVLWLPTRQTFGCCSAKYISATLSYRHRQSEAATWQYLRDCDAQHCLLVTTMRDLNFEQCLLPAQHLLGIDDLCSSAVWVHSDVWSSSSDFWAVLKKTSHVWYRPGLSNITWYIYVHIADQNWATQLTSVHMCLYMHICVYMYMYMCIYVHVRIFCHTSHMNICICHVICVTFQLWEPDSVPTCCAMICACVTGMFPNC